MRWRKRGVVSTKAYLKVACSATTDYRLGWLRFDTNERAAAIGAWIYGLLWSRQQELDGFIIGNLSDHIGGPKVFERLVEKNFVIRDEHDGMHGYRALLDDSYLSRIESVTRNKPRTTESQPIRWLYFVGGAGMESREWLEWCRARPRKPSKDVRAAVIERDGYVCKICGHSVSRYDVHLDHIIPYSHGGETTVENLRVTHARCNLQKNGRLDS